MTTDSYPALAIGLAPWALLAVAIYRSKRREENFAAKLRGFRSRQAQADLRHRAERERRALNEIAK